MENEELVAYAVEEAVKAKVSPASIVGQWLSRLKALLAQKFGFVLSKITSEDLVNFAYGAAQLTRNESQIGVKMDDGMEPALSSFQPMIKMGEEVGQ
jgi:hypothetical protein